MKTQRIAVVGAGIAGLASAWLLNRSHRVTLFEADSRPGGHTNTVDVHLEGRSHPVDTGFLVFNDRTYPNLVALFSHLGVASVATEMSFAVSLDEPDLEWAGSNLATVFGQKRNLLRPRFWGMLADILRFNRESRGWLAGHPDDARPLDDFLREGGYSAAFADWYLLPMAAAIWSCPTGRIRDMPLDTFVRFCDNHGLLQVFDRPTWRSVAGGGREYVRRIIDTLDDVRLGCPVQTVRRRPEGGLVVQHAGGSAHFDQVVLACHSDQALAILGDGASPRQREILAAIRYQPNRAVLHTDPAQLPRERKLWSAWNYLAAAGTPEHQPVAVSYLINKLQPLPFETPVIVTLNPVREPDPAQVLAEFDYAHPIFDRAAIDAQNRLDAAQGEHGVWLAGAWGRYGFHEDGLRSALNVCNRLGVRAPWQGAAVVPLRPAAPTPEVRAA